MAFRDPTAAPSTPVISYLPLYPLRGPGSSSPMTFISLPWRRLPPRPLPLPSVLSDMMRVRGMERTDLVEEEKDLRAWLFITVGPMKKL